MNSNLVKSKMTIETERDERARRAVTAFRSLQPTLSAFARALTKRNDVTVVMDSGDPRTDGKIIYFRPSIELGDHSRHNLSMCDKRDSTLTQTCQACKIREQVLVVIYHEIAHLCFDSFAPPSAQDKLELVQRAFQESGGKRAAAIQARIDSSPYYKKGSYIGLAGLISEYLPVLVNALEDARVNREMFKVRPGTKAMFEAEAHRALVNGNQTPEGDTVYWKDYPLNSQAAVGVLCIAAGYNFQDLLDPVVEAALTDQELNKLVRQIDTVKSAEQVYRLSFLVLYRLRDLGFCIDNPEDEPEADEDGIKPKEKSDEPEKEDGISEGDSDVVDSDNGGCPERGDDSDGVDSGDGGHDDGQSETEGSKDESGDGNQREVSGDPSQGPDEGGSSSDDPDGSSNPDQSEQSSSEGSPSSEGAAGEKEEFGEGGAGNGSDSKSGQGSGGSEESNLEKGSAEGDSGTSEGVSGHGTPDPSDGNSDLNEPGDSKGDPSKAAGGANQRGDLSGSGSEPSESGVSDESGSDARQSELAQSNLGNESQDQEIDSSSIDPSGSAHDYEEAGTNQHDPRPGDPSSEPEPDTEVDTGSDQGKGGIRIEDSDLEYGTAADASQALSVFGDHDEDLKGLSEIKDEQAVDVAVVQGMYFEKPSRNILGVSVHKYNDDNRDSTEGWGKSGFWGSRKGNSEAQDLNVSESVLGPALLRMRVAFSENRRSDMDRNRRSGRVSARVLGKRAWGNDDRLFQKKTVPGKRDYFVVIGIDISGSTYGLNLKLAKRAALAQAELLNRMGIKFAVYAHTALSSSINPAGMDLEIYEIKSGDDPWTAKQSEALTNLNAVADNLDGHSIEFYRKRLDESNATCKIVLYYTDGKMPAANHDEELEILQREIATFKRKGYTLLGVGIRTDSPTRHGLDTVQVDTDEDMVKVVHHLEKKLI